MRITNQDWDAKQPKNNFYLSVQTPLFWQKKVERPWMGTSPSKFRSGVAVANNFFEKKHKRWFRENEILQLIIFDLFSFFWFERRKKDKFGIYRLLTKRIKMFLFMSFLQNQKSDIIFSLKNLQATIFQKRNLQQKKVS